MWSWPRLSAEHLDLCPRLRFAGHLDMRAEYARALLERGVAVSITRHAWAPAVAEMALTLILSTLRKTPTHQCAMWSGTEKWVSIKPDDIDPMERELAGRKVGLVGFGAVGRRLKQLLAPFECDIAIHDPYLPAEIAQGAGVKNLTMDALVKHAEVLVLCASANKGSKHVLGAPEIGALQAGAVVVNVARASLIDGEALLARLRRGDISAALDVFDQEPLPLDSEWRKLPNVYLTPHRAGGILASAERIFTCLCSDLHAHLAEKERHYALMPAMLTALDA